MTNKITTDQKQILTDLAAGRKPHTQANKILAPLAQAGLIKCEYVKHRITKISLTKWGNSWVRTNTPHPEE